MPKDNLPEHDHSSPGNGGSRIVADDISQSETPLFQADSTQSASPSFDTFRQVSADRPSLVFATVRLKSGGDLCKIGVSVDTDGNGVQDYDPAQTLINQSQTIFQQFTFFVPAGGQYRIDNLNDPTGFNEIRIVRELIL